MRIDLRRFFHVSRTTGDTFDFDRCVRCRFVFVRHPRTDFANLYDANYYAGAGADPTVDYVSEMKHPLTVRAYEWQGVLRVVEHLAPVTSTTRWLDYGCGLGGLVRWVRKERRCEIVGFEKGYTNTWLDRAGIPGMTGTEFDDDRGSFDIVTAIEVLEHAVDPIGLLTEIRALMRPGGVLLLTTGNAEPFRERMTRWSYASVPDVHVSYFDPTSLSSALERTGFEPLSPKYWPGLDDIIRYKVLKGMRVKRRNTMEKLVPWNIASHVVDRRHRISVMPLASRAS